MTEALRIPKGMVRFDRWQPFRVTFILLLLLFSPARFQVHCALAAAATPGAAERAGNLAVAQYGYEIVATYDHDPQAFTQGFCFADGMLYEGTGLYGQSTLRRVTLAGTGLELRRLPDFYFGEGVTVFGDRVIQLTWQTGNPCGLSALFPMPPKGGALPMTVGS